MLPGVTIGERVARAYRKHLFGDATLQHLPDEPRFVINATNIQSGVLWRFPKPYMWDYRVGKVPSPDLSLATAVAASSAFPPVLSPLRLKLRSEDFEPNTGLDLQRARRACWRRLLAANGDSSRITCRAQRALAVAAMSARRV